MPQDAVNVVAWTGIGFGLIAAVLYAVLFYLLNQLPTSREGLDQIKANTPAITRFLMHGAAATVERGGKSFSVIRLHPAAAFPMGSDCWQRDLRHHARRHFTVVLVAIVLVPWLKSRLYKMVFTFPLKGDLRRCE